MRNQFFGVLFCFLAGGLTAADLSETVTVNGQALLHMKADEWLIQGQAFKTGVSRTVVENNLKAPAARLQNDLNKNFPFLREVKVQGPIIYPVARRGMGGGLPGMGGGLPPMGGGLPAGGGVDPTTGLPIGGGGFPGAGLGGGGGVLGAVPSGRVNGAKPNEIIWNGTVIVSMIVPAENAQIEKITGLDGFKLLAGSLHITPRLSNEKEVEARVQKMALQEAKRRAVVLAGIAHKEVGEVLSISENYSGVGGGYGIDPMTGLPIGPGVFYASSGRVEVSSNLTVSFRLQTGKKGVE